MIVVDASALLDVLLRTPAAGAIEARLFEPGETLHAPHLVDLEVVQVIRRHAADGVIDARRGGAMLAYLAGFPLHRYPHYSLLPRVWELRNNFTAYDAAYVALAETLAAPLLTLDRHLASAARHYTRVEVI